MAAFVPFDNANDYRTTALKRVEGKDCTGKVFIVTGASGALGKQLTLAFTTVNATVIAAGRTMSKLEAAKDEIMTKNGGKGTIDCMTLDLNDYDSIKAFAEAVKSKYKQFDVLINNAGMVPFHEYKESKYGLEMTFQSNFVSTVVLTESLLSLLAKDGRIIHLSSMSHADASKPIKWETIPSTKETFGGYNKDYAESKWLLTTYSYALNKRISQPSVCADPGVSPDSAMWDQQAFMIRFLARYVFKPLCKTGPQAAGCAAHLAVCDDIKGGGYYQSGVLVPALRSDTEDDESWSKAADVLEKALPEDLRWCVKK